MSAPAPLALSMLTAAECDAIVAHTLASTDERRLDWESLVADDKVALLIQANRALGNLRWIGRRQVLTNPLPFPRVFDPFVDIEEGSPGEYSLANDGWSVAAIPRVIREGLAQQAAYEAHMRMGGTEAVEVRRQARQGVASLSGVGGSRTIDMHRATAPESRVDPDVWELVGAFIATSGEAL